MECHREHQMEKLIGLGLALGYGTALCPVLPNLKFE